MPNVLTADRVTAYCSLRLTPLLGTDAYIPLTDALVRLADVRTPLPLKAGRVLYSELSLLSGLAVKQLRPAHGVLVPLLAAMARARAQLAKVRPFRSGVQPKTKVDVAPIEPAVVLPARFDLALAELLALHGDSAWRVAWSLCDQGLRISGGTLKAWANGRTRPRGRRHWPHLRAIALRYGLAENTLIERLSTLPPVAADILASVPKAMRADLAWHLPADFSDRTPEVQAEILFWIMRTLGSGSTDYRRYLQDRLQAPYALPLRTGDGVTPPRLLEEIDALLAFKTTAFVPIGWQRNGVWNGETAAQKRVQLGQMFGALGQTGIKPHALSLGLLVLPQVWDLWLRWREERRGFYVAGEADFLRLAEALARPGTGWLRQSPQLGGHLRVVKDLVKRDQIAEVRGDWASACDRLLVYARGRALDIRRVARVHRDPFEPILAVLEADGPICEYRKICDEIERRLPDARAHPVEAAEAMRSLLMLRLGLHLGLRQKNLRELLLCPRGRRPTPERKLEVQRRGELRWTGTAWEVLIPAAAFKNAGSSFFEGLPFRLVLPDIGGLYALISEWINKHRPILIGRAADPGVVLVATARGPKTDVTLDKTAFYDLWRRTIVRYGVFNPYTRRGAITGLLPHGPHGVRDVLATHILKATGSYEHAGYAIQDTAETVARHYGRFLPKDKSALAAQIINKVWIEDRAVEPVASKTS